LVLCARPGLAEEKRPPLWGPLEAGPFAVGYRLLDHRDGSRRLADGALRPIQISVWYPAMANPGPAMHYRDYVLVTGSERSLTTLDEPGTLATTARYLGFLAGNGVPAEAGGAWLAARMMAVRDAPPIEGRRPLVVIAQGNGGAAPDQALLAEYLASHGYVVATSPSPLRLGAAMESERDILPVAREEARDLAFVIERARTLSRVEGSSLGLVGYSFGARSALLLAASMPGLRGLVSLDGGIGSRTGKGWLTPGALARERVACPILHVFEDTEEFMTPDFALLASLRRAPRTLLKVAGMRHTDLITFGMASATIPGMGGDAAATQRLRERVRAAFSYTRAFLDAHVVGKAEARAFLDRAPEENGFGPGLVTLSRRSTSGARPRARGRRRAGSSSGRRPGRSRENEGPSPPHR
jgi:dienelactone hydrolase